MPRASLLSNPHSRSWSRTRSDPPAPQPAPTALIPPSGDGVSQAPGFPAPVSKQWLFQEVGGEEHSAWGTWCLAGRGLHTNPWAGRQRAQKGAFGPAPCAEESEAQGSRFPGRLCRQPGLGGPGIRGSVGWVWGKGVNNLLPPQQPAPPPTTGGTALPPGPRGLPPAPAPRPEPPPPPAPSSPSLPPSGVGPWRSHHLLSRSECCEGVSLAVCLGWEPARHSSLTLACQFLRPVEGDRRLGNGRERGEDGVTGTWHVD